MFIEWVHGKVMRFRMLLQVLFWRAWLLPAVRRR